MRQMRERQLTLARIIAKHGRSLKAVALESGLPYSTLRSYFPGERDATPAIMPITGLALLFGVLPDDWLSILIEPEGRRFAPEETPEGDPCAVLREARNVIDDAIIAMGGGK